MWVGIFDYFPHQMPWILVWGPSNHAQSTSQPKKPPFTYYTRDRPLSLVFSRAGSLLVGRRASKPVLIDFSTPKTKESIPLTVSGDNFWHPPVYLLSIALSTYVSIEDRVFVSRRVYPCLICNQGFWGTRNRLGMVSRPSGGSDEKPTDRPRHLVGEIFKYSN